MVIHLERPRVETGRPSRRLLPRVERRVTGGLGRLAVVEVVRSGQTNIT